MLMEALLKLGSHKDLLELLHRQTLLYLGLLMACLLYGGGFSS